MMPSDSDVEDIVKRTITLYNRLHISNAFAKLITLTPPILIIEFTGTFCATCSTIEITDGFEEHLKTLSGDKIKLKQGKTTQTNLHTIQTTYTIKNK